MAEIDILLPARTRRWQTVLADRLRAAGHDVRLIATPPADAWPALVETALAAEHRLSRCDGRLSARADCGAGAVEARANALRIDLSGAGAPSDGLSLLFDGKPSAASAAITLMAGRLPELTMLRGGRTIATARPMIDGIGIGRGLDDVLARAISLVVAAADGGGAHAADTAPAGAGSVPGGSLAGGLLSVTAPRLLRTVGHRLARRRHHWRIGYRFLDGRGVAETGSLAGPDWRVLPDDGSRYYADPFAFEWQGRFHLFMEEYPHRTGKGLISVCAFDEAERPSVPRVVLEEPYHLSYPQVFAMGGEVWMLPEGGASRQLVLYRAAAFPDRWERHAVLIDGRELFDATLLEHEGRFWLFATERDGAGSSSDMLVAFHADRLEGPWRPHRGNPILIDRATARSAGAMVRIGRRIVRPVQDGTTGYGGGMNFVDLLRLDEEAVVFSQPVPLLPANNWAYPAVHTLNRAGRLEVIDGVARMRVPATLEPAKEA